MPDGKSGLARQEAGEEQQHDAQPNHGPEPIKKPLRLKEKERGSFLLPSLARMVAAEAGSPFFAALSRVTFGVGLLEILDGQLGVVFERVQALVAE